MPTIDFSAAWELLAKAYTPQKEGIPSPNGGIDPNPDDSTVRSPHLADRGSKNQEKMAKNREGADSMDDDSDKPDIDNMQYYMGGLQVETDPQTGLAKWPLSFKRIEKDVKRPNKPGNHRQNLKVGPDGKKMEQPPTCV